MNQSIITGLGTPQLSRIIEEGEQCSRRTEDPSLFNPTDRTHQGEADEEQELNRIEAEISGIGKQLQSLHLQMKRMLDKYSQEYLEKEGRRNTLRKHLIDLDFSHKTIFAKRIRRNNANSIVHQFYQTQTQQHPTPPRSSDKLPIKDTNEATSARITKFASPTKSYKGEINSSQKVLQNSQRRVRTTEKQYQAGEEKMRKSRVDQLARQLVQLRATYSSPYLQGYYYPAYDDYYSGWWPY